MHKHGGTKTSNRQRKEWKNLSKDELMTFIGLVILAGSEKNWDVPIRDLFGSPLDNPVYKATMSIGRFEDIRCFLLFDDKSLPTGNRPHGSLTLHMGPVPVQLQAEIHAQ